MALAISVRVDESGEWRAIAEVSLVCANCHISSKDTIVRPITGTYDFSRHRIDWDEGVLKSLRELPPPDGWVSREKSTTYSGEGYPTTLDWHCPDCLKELEI